MTRHQRGHIFEAHGAFHVRYYTMVDGVRKQKSKKLCEDFMRTVNTEAPEVSSLEPR